MEEIKLEPHIFHQLIAIEIWSPRYSTEECLILKRKTGHYSKIDSKKHYKIWFSKAKHLAGKEFYLRGSTITGSRSSTNGTKACWAVPMNQLKLIQRERSW